MNGNYKNSLEAAAEKMKYEQAQAQCTSGQALGRDTVGIGSAGLRCSSLLEEAERQVGFHREQADKRDRAAAFFREHPEFDEFVQLIRSGVIGI